MTAQQNGNAENVSNETDLVQVCPAELFWQCDRIANVHQAFQDLVRGERTAAALEHHLTALEKKIDELLVKADEEERIRMEQSKGSQAQPSKSSNEDKSASSS
jgi:hypothetical protein